MRKLSYLILVLALVLPLAVPFAALAQEDPVLASLEAYNANLPAGYGNISVADLAITLIDNPDLVLVDVRQPEEYAESHIPGAVDIPLRDLAKNLDLPPALDEPMVVYCGSAFRSAIAMTSLQILGYTDVKSMSGGFRAWLGEEYATTTEPPEAEASTAPVLDADVLAAVDAQLSGLPEGWGSVKPEDLNIELIENPPDRLIDVRTPAEWETGYIAGAVHMPLEELMSFVGDWPENKDANIVVYCKSGHRGNMAATMMRTLGYTNIRNLSGGFLAWGTEGLPIEGAEPAAAEFDAVALFTAYIESLPASFNAIRVEDLNAEIGSNPDVLLVDVRTVDEYADGHLQGAINIPLIELTDHLDLLPDQSQDIVVYCGSGHRSALGMVALNLLGYDNAWSLLGGVKAWTGADLEVTTDVTGYAGGTAPEFDAAVFEMVDAYVKAIPAGYYTISADNLNLALIENPPLLIDVRTDPEVANGLIEGAVHWELREFMAHMDEWPADTTTPVVVYSLGHRSVIGMMVMQMLGYENVSSLAGGINAWTTGGYPVVVE
jgi:rhodanese-related sulfurtransferase